MNAPCSRDIHFYEHGICYDVKINGLFWHFKCEPQPLHSIHGVEGSWTISLNFRWEEMTEDRFTSEWRQSIRDGYVTIFIGYYYAPPIILAPMFDTCRVIGFHSTYDILLTGNFLPNDIFWVFPKKIKFTKYLFNWRSVHEVEMIIKRLQQSFSLKFLAQSFEWTYRSQSLTVR